MPRRKFLTRLAGLAGSVAAATALLPLIEPNYAWGQQVPPADPRLEQGYIEYAGPAGPVRAYFAKPSNLASPLPGILVIHENRGLNAHIEDVARRAALAGYVALAPDGLSFVGGAPADQEAARDLFGKADRAIIAADVITGMKYLRNRDECSGKIGSVGFCYGGGVSLHCAIAEKPADASVCFYGRSLNAEQVAALKQPVLLHYAGNDTRINGGISDFRAALDTNNIAYSMHMYPDTSHGFHNDTSEARYDKAAASLAWQRSLAFFKHYLNL